MNAPSEQAPNLHPIDAVVANYIDGELAEYQGNPLIEALPPILEDTRVLKALANRPPYKEDERLLPKHLRARCLLRLFDYFEPLGRHVDLAQRIDMIMRDAYKARSPRGPAFRARLQEIYELRQSKTSDRSAVDPPSSGMSFSLIGVSGTGKTRSLRRSLARYPQVIWHPEHKLYQIPWLIVECPHDGSVKALCLSFFQNIDKLLRTNYAKRFGGRDVTVETRMLEVAQIARLHCIGVIVLDELQHIQPAGPDGVQKMLNFFVTLVNLSEAAVVLVGTMGAQRLLQHDFRQARRGAGFGSMVWPRSERDAEWDYLMGRLWKYQWTQKATEITDDIKEAFYDLTQGIVDLAVKLYILSQYRAMATKVEEVTSELMRQVAAEDFAILEPMLSALRSRDPVEIAKFDDLKPLDFEKVLAREQLRMGADVDVETLRKLAEEDEQVRRNQTTQAVTATGVPPAAVEAAVAAVFTADGSLPATKATAKVLKLVEKGSQRGSRGKSSENQVAPELEDDDLRKIIAAGKETGMKPLEALVAKGAAISPSEHFVR